jgi:CelD/BcsL family acetyltransferase involved in cellulose biosynthesis
MLTVERLSGFEEFVALREEWDALDRALSPRTPFTSLSWNALWWTHFNKSSLFVKDEFFGCTVRDAALRLVAVAPMMRTHRPSFGGIRIKEIQFFGADPNMTELRGPICKPEDQGAVLRVLRDYFSNTDTKWNWIRWQGIRRDAPNQLTTLGDDSHFRWTRTVPDYVLHLQSDWTAFEHGLSRRVRKKLRSCYRLLEKDGHVIDFRVISHPSNIGSAVETFFDLHRIRAQVRYFDVFSDPRAQAFFREYALASAARGEIKVFQLAFDDVVVATRLGFSLGNEVYLYHAGNDPRWDDYSIMTTLLAEIIKWSITQGATLLNLSTGNDRSKTRWNPSEITYCDGIEVCTGLVGDRLSRGYEFFRSQMSPGSSAKKLIRSALNGFRSLPDPSEPSMTAENES